MTLFKPGHCAGCIQIDCPLPQQFKRNPTLGCDMWTDGVDVEQDELLPFEIEAGFYQEEGVTKLRGKENGE